LHSGDNAQYRAEEWTQVKQSEWKIHQKDRDHPCARTHLDIRSNNDLSSASRTWSYTRSVLSATVAQEYMSFKRSWAMKGSCRPVRMILMALLNAVIMSAKMALVFEFQCGVISSPSASGRANSIISSGRTSGTPPTFVLTIKRPVDAASMMLEPNASVRDVER
jgi:hypothetical protein